MLTVGGAISGYSAIGKALSAISPRMVKIIDSTAAKIGRSMKKCGKRMERAYLRSVYFWFSVVFTAPWFGATFAPGRTAGLAKPSMTI